MYALGAKDAGRGGGRLYDVRLKRERALTISESSRGRGWPEPRLVSKSRVWVRGAVWGVCGARFELMKLAGANNQIERPPPCPAGSGSAAASPGAHRRTSATVKFSNKTQRREETGDRARARTIICAICV